MPRVPFHSICQPQAHIYWRSGVRLEISNQKSHYIYQLGSISKISQETSMSCSEHIPSYCAIKLPSCLSNRNPFQNSIPAHPLPHTDPNNNINLPTPLLPLTPPPLYLTHGLYQATLGSHTGHTVLEFKAGSHSHFKSHTQLCIQSFVGVKKRL